MEDWDDQYFEHIIERFTSSKNVGDSPPVEEYADVIESGDEDFYSVREDKLDETQADALHSINIQLKDSPHIILEDGTHKTKISVTHKYLEKNGLELSIGEGPARNIRLKAGDAEIYPSDKALPSGINISVTDEKGSEKKDAEVDMSHEGENIKYCDSVSPAGKLGLLSLVIDNLEQQNIGQLAEDKFQSCHAGGNIVQCISDYAYLKACDKREVGLYEKKDKETLERIFRENAEMLRKKKVDPEILKLQEKEMYKRVKNKFFKTVLDGDPRMDKVKRDLIEELIRQDKEAPVKQKCKTTQVQTEVHINPGAVDDYSFSDDSDSILRRFNALREVSTISSSVRDPPQTKPADQNNSHEATIGQIDTDFSARTELTMEGISDLTERNVVGIQTEKEDATDDDVSDLSVKVKKSPSITSIEKRSKLVDTQELEDEILKDVALVSDRNIKSPSLIKALKSFDEELNPLKQELTRLLNDFKSIEIPEDVQISVAAERLPMTPSTPASSPSDRPSTSAEYFPNPDESIHHLYRTGLPGPLIRGEPCHCAPGICLGFGRSSGIICQRVKRLPASASSSEFFREFTRPEWINGTFRHHSILSDPEDIYGDRFHRRQSSSMSIHDEDMYNKSDSK